MYRYSIAFIAFLQFFAVQVKAQYMSGNVVVHSDPRLAVLLKKNPTAAPPITPVSSADELGRKARNTPKTTAAKELSKPAIQDHLKPKIAEAPTHQPGVAPASQEIAANMPKKLNAPPVHPFVAPPTHKDGRVIYSGKGFRVQIYSGNDRDKAIKIKTEFMRLYPAMHTYLSYAAPCFRVKVGDYRNHNDALGMLKEANSMYNSPCMIVPDEVTIHAY